MSDIVERLHLYAGDDHKRLCQGREYSCSCGYDDKRDPLLKEAAFEIGRLLNLMADARTENMHLRAALENKWRPIVTAPKDGRWILVSAPNMKPETACWSTSVWLTGWYSGGGRSASYGPGFEPTHWMPLPPAPGKEEA